MKAMTIGDTTDCPDGAYWLRSHTGYAIVRGGIIVEIVQLVSGPWLWRTARRAMRGAA
jgi:hypothetical protein